MLAVMKIGIAIVILSTICTVNLGDALTYGLLK